MRLGMTVLGAALVAGAVAFAQDAGVRLTPEEMAPPAAPGGVGTSGVAAVRTTVLKGDPAGEGLYTLLLRIAPNTRIEAHAHPDDRVATVIAGTWYIGYGETFDAAGLKALPPGSFYTEPPGGNHFAETRDEPVVVQITGSGPSGTVYVDPAHDPARR